MQQPEEVQAYLTGILSHMVFARFEVEFELRELIEGKAARSIVHWYFDETRISAFNHADYSQYSLGIREFDPTNQIVKGITTGSIISKSY